MLSENPCLPINKPNTHTSTHLFTQRPNAYTHHHPLTSLIQHIPLIHSLILRTHRSIGAAPHIVFGVGDLPPSLSNLYSLRPPLSIFVQCARHVCVRMKIRIVHAMVRLYVRAKLEDCARVRQVRLTKSEEGDASWGVGNWMRRVLDLWMPLQTSTENTTGSIAAWLLESYTQGLTFFCWLPNK